MPWKGVTVSEQRQRFLEDYQLSYYTITELAERFSISPRQPTSGSIASSSMARPGFRSSPAGRAAARGRPMQRSPRNWWRCEKHIPGGARGNCST